MARSPRALALVHIALALVHIALALVHIALALVHIALALVHIAGPVDGLLNGHAHFGSW
jgi:hypothetical protein